MKQTMHRYKMLATLVFIAWNLWREENMVRTKEKRETMYGWDVFGHMRWTCCCGDVSWVVRKVSYMERREVSRLLAWLLSLSLD